MPFGTDDTEDTLKNARTFAKSGATLGAAAGSRLGPVSTGLASGLGGAVGYLAGAAVDGAQATIESKPPVTDGGRQALAETTDTASVTEIPVTDES